MPKKYTKEEIGKKFRLHMEKKHHEFQFDFCVSIAFGEWSAEQWGLSTSRISNIFSGREAPTAEMLSDMGFKKVKQTWFEKV